MKYGNFYDLESLTLLNRHEGCACSIKECDVEKVNRLISRMREDRERAGLPTAGDVVTYITRGGDYYPQAHIERGDDREVHICLLPQTPFCHENEKCTGYNTEGGPLGYNRSGIADSRWHTQQTVPDVGAYRKAQERCRPLPHIRQGMEIHGTRSSVRKVHHKRMDEIHHRVSAGY